MSTSDQPRSLLTPRQVAARLGLSVVQIRRMYAELGAFRVGDRAIRFDGDRIEAWIEERKSTEAVGQETTPSGA